MEVPVVVSVASETEHLMDSLRIGFRETNFRAVLAVASERGDDVEDKPRPKSCLEEICLEAEEEIVLGLALGMEKEEPLKLIAISMPLTLSLFLSRVAA